MDLLLLFVVLLVVFAVFGGVWISNFLWLILIVALVLVLFEYSRRGI